MAEDLAAARERRRRLPVRPNPRPGLDYIVSLGGSLVPPGASGAIEVRLRYVPDRDVLPAAVFSDYLSVLGATRWEDLESLGVAVLGDLDSELVPRWMQLSLSAAASEGGEYSVMLEARQPKWDNSRLLARLAPI